MKTFKSIDIKISILLIVLSVVIGMIEPGYAVLGYFFVGGWQIISMIIHELTGSFTARSSARRNYHLFVLVILILAGLFTVMLFAGADILGFILVLLVLMLPGGIVMAVYYISLCHHEYKTMKLRDLASLR